MPPKRLFKRQASKTLAIGDVVKQRRIESESTSPPPTTLQFYPSELSDAIANTTSGALQSAGIVKASQFQPGTSSTSVIKGCREGHAYRNRGHHKVRLRR